MPPVENLLQLSGKSELYFPQIEVQPKQNGFVRLNLVQFYLKTYFQDTSFRWVM